MRWRDTVQDYFTFGKKERIAFGILVIVVGIVLLLPKIIPSSGNGSGRVNDTIQVASATKLKESEQQDSYQEYDYKRKQYSSNSYKDEKPVRIELFSFDPNNTSPGDWKRLGLRDRTIKTINNYLSKGGRFRKPEDLTKIYGLRAEEYERIAAYINIQQQEKNHTNVAPSYLSMKPAARTYAVIDINLADTADFISLPGIGQSRARTIINFRNKLGGFYSIDQIAETYGLPDSVFQMIKPYLKLNETAIRTININTATVDELKAHPYIRWNLANAIVQYRNQHGAYKNLEELMNIALMDENLFMRIKPYLKIE